MAAQTTKVYKCEKRRETRSQTREAIFISEYVQNKYARIFEEAAEAYNNLNNKYPRKPDLRRTDEFRLWKISVSSNPSGPFSKQKPRQYRHIAHRNIPLQQRADPTASLSVQPDVPESPPPESESSPPPAKRPRAEPEKIMMLRIPLLTPSQSEPEAPVETPAESSESVTEEVIQEPEAPVETPAESYESVTEEVIQEPEAPVETPDESYESVTEEVIQQSSENLYPSLLDELSPEIIEKIIAELREEPAIKDVMAEEQIEVEEVGLEIDIPDLYDPLEDELANICW